MTARGRRNVLLAAAGAALVTGVAVGAGAGEEGRPAAARAAVVQVATPAPKVRSAARRLPAVKLAGSVVMLRFHGATAPPYVLKAFRRGWAAGAILFPDNAPSPRSVRALARSLQRAGNGKVLLATDQEGGSVRRLSWAAPLSAQPARSTEVAAAAAARASGKDLRASGLNVAFAPVADLGGGVMEARAFPGSTAQVARLTAAAVRGYRGTGVSPTAKHFPGLGAATVNTDDAPATVRRAGRDIGAFDLPPFRAAIRAGVPLIMLSHAVYPALDARNIASQSHVIATDLLRGKLGFKGVAVTDSIEARAVTARSGPGRAAIRSIRAGADLILLTGPGSHLPVVRALTAEARRSKSFRARLAEASARVTVLRESRP